MAVSKKNSVSCPNCESRIVHRTGLNLKEKILAYFLPAEIYQCQPCGMRFARYGNPFAREKSRRILIPLALMIVFFISFLIFLLIGNGEPSTTKIRKSEKQQVNKTPAPDTSRTVTLQKSVAPPVLIIKLGNSRKFGVNWEYNGIGLKITRLSPGPLQKAGFKVGDILVSVDGKPLTDDKKFLQFRDKIYSGSGKELLIEVVRGEEKFFYKLIK
jgi:hypothetical protein